MFSSISVWRRLARRPRGTHRTRVATHLSKRVTVVKYSDADVGRACRLELRAIERACQFLNSRQKLAASRGVNCRAYQ
jgi:hypothetical protein